MTTHTRPAVSLHGIADIPIRNGWCHVRDIADATGIDIDDLAEGNDDLWIPAAIVLTLARLDSPWKHEIRRREQHSYCGPLTPADLDP